MKLTLNGFYNSEDEEMIIGVYVDGHDHPSDQLKDTFNDPQGEYYEEFYYGDLLPISEGEVEEVGKEMHLEVVEDEKGEGYWLVLHENPVENSQPILYFDLELFEQK